jgi:phage shock protein A
MAIDNKFRINELMTSGSRAIISKNEVTGNHIFVQGSKEVVNDPYPHNKGERDGEQVGKIQKPKYNEDELKKAVDTVVDELLSEAPKPQPEVVPKSVYDDLRKKYQKALQDLATANQTIAQLRTEVQTLQSEIEALLVENDSLKVKTAVAENEAQISQERYIGVLADFSNSILKGTRDGIERVSLKAQVEGLQAQKEALRQLLIQTQGQLEIIKSQLSGAAAESSAAASGLTPTDSNETFYGFEQNGSDDAWSANDIGWTTSKNNPKSDGFGGSLTLQNLRDENVSITQLRINVDKGNLLGSIRPILGFGNSLSSTRTTNIEQGAKETIKLYFNTNMGGRGDEKPKPRVGAFDGGARTYTGSFTIDVIYTDGFSETINATWGLRKNRG